MTVNTYLTQRASDAVLTEAEKSSIAKSIATMQTRLNLHFGKTVSEHFKFGSFTRDTILPRSMDALSDIDYMVVFSEGGYTPQTYLNRLRAFVEKYYSTSEIAQSSPTIVLDLNHIRFELVPALSQSWSGYQIPDGPSAWQLTNPNDFNNALVERNKLSSYLLKPTIRLVKMWNSNQGHVFGSYFLEKWMAEQWYYGCSNIAEHLFLVFDNVSLPYGVAQWRVDALDRAREIVRNVRGYLLNGWQDLAEVEIKKLIPV